MCGIAGIIAEDKVDFSQIKKMTDIISHRGPDASGQFKLLNGKVALGHRRLSILDLSGCGKQPMGYMNCRYWITYNGEIYNYIELRRTLKTLGYSFKSNTDTEVIMAAYDYWGKECLHKFNGMWAFIIIDTFSDKIFAARDRFGVKPFYYWHSPNGFYAFASEIKQFTVLTGWSPKLNGQRAYDFLNWALTDHTEETLFDGVFQLRGGQAFECPINEVKNSLPIYQWYTITERSFNGNIDIAAEQFREIFIDAIKLRLRADVPVGSCLSGGLDSSSIVCVVNELLKKNNIQDLQKTISACVHIKKYDEREFIDEVISLKNIKGYYTYPIFDDLFKLDDRITWHQDEPFGSTSIYAQWCVFELAAKKGIRVMLDGQGADEQLAGYHSFFAPHFTGLLKSLNWIQLFDEVRQCKKIHNYDLMFAVKGLANSLLPEYLRNHLRKYCGNNISPEWLNMKRLGAVPLNPFTAVGGKAKDIRELSISQLTATNLQMLLHWEDRDSMAHSVESRLPFLDYRLVEYVVNLPDEYKLSQGVTKRVLRKSMQGVLPEKIRLRMDKMGFVTPEEVWMRNNSKIFRDKLNDSLDISNEILNNRLFNYFDKVVKGEKNFDFTIWRMINFGTWMKQFRVNA